MKIIVDTNFVFSALLNPSGKISELLLNSHPIFEFIAPDFLLDELDKHRNKLLKLSGYTKSDLAFLVRMVLKKVEIINLEIISSEVCKESIEIASDIDEFDAPFIALSLEAKSPLWTGDKKLINGLKNLGYPHALDTTELYQLRQKKE